MPAFQFYDPAPSFRDVLAENVIGGGSLTFYERGTTTPKNTWSDPELTVLNTNPIVLDSAGRPNVGIFGDGEYSVKCMDVAGNTIWTRVIIPGGETALTFPTLLADQFYTSDGSNILATYIIQVPDPTGELGNILYSDDLNAYWGPPPAIPETEPLPAGGVVVTTTTVLIGDTMIQTGSGSAPASGSNTTSVAVVFGTAMDSLQHVSITPTVTVVGTGGYQAVAAYTSPTGTGFTANFDSNAGGGSAGNIIVPVTFTYTAIGKKA